MSNEIIDDIADLAERINLLADAIIALNERLTAIEEILNECLDLDTDN